MTTADDLSPMSLKSAVIEALDDPLFHKTAAILFPLKGPAHTCKDIPVLGVFKMILGVFSRALNFILVSSKLVFFPFRGLIIKGIPRVHLKRLLLLKSYKI